MPEDRRSRRRATQRQRGLNQENKADARTTPSSKPLPQPNRRYRPSETAKRAQELLQSNKPRRRMQTLFPYLMIRTAPGDAGARPISPPAMPWECCDIHLMPAGAGDFDFARTVLKPQPGETYRVFVHVWNLRALLRLWCSPPCMVCRARLLQRPCRDDLSAEVHRRRLLQPG